MDGIAEALDQTSGTTTSKGPELLALIQLHAADPPGPVLLRGDLEPLAARGCSTGGTRQAGDFETLVKTFIDPRRVLRVIYRLHPLHPQGRGAVQGRPAAPPDAGRRAGRRAGQGRRASGGAWSGTRRASGKTYTMITVAKTADRRPGLREPDRPDARGPQRAGGAALRQPGGGRLRQRRGRRESSSTCRSCSRPTAGA